MKGLPGPQQGPVTTSVRDNPGPLHIACTKAVRWLQTDARRCPSGTCTAAVSCCQGIGSYLAFAFASHSTCFAYSKAYTNCWQGQTTCRSSLPSIVKDEGLSIHESPESSNPLVGNGKKGLYIEFSIASARHFLVGLPHKMRSSR